MNASTAPTALRVLPRSRRVRTKPTSTAIVPSPTAAGASDTSASGLWRGRWSLDGNGNQLTSPDAEACFGRFASFCTSTSASWCLLITTRLFEVADRL